MQEKLQEIILGLYREYEELDGLVKTKNQEITNNKNNLREVLKDKTPEELQQVLVHIYVDTILYNKDLQQLYLTLYLNIDTYLQVSDVNLPEHIMNFYKDAKFFVPKRVFKVEKGEIIETEVGKLEEARKMFLESEDFKKFREAVKDK